MVRKAKFINRGSYALSNSQLKWLQDRIDKGLFDSVNHGIRYCINMQRFEGKNAGDVIVDFARDLGLSETDIGKIIGLFTLVKEK